MLRLAASVITGLSASLIAYSMFFVRGDVAGVVRYLRLRGAARRLVQGHAEAVQVQVAQAQLHDLGLRLADPALAAQLLPVALLVGVVTGWLIWRLFSSQTAQEARPDAQERMVYRLAHRKGGRFTLRDLTEQSPLTAEQARAVTTSMLVGGRLTRDGEEYRLT